MRQRQLAEMLGADGIRIARELFDSIPAKFFVRPKDFTTAAKECVNAALVKIGKPPLPKVDGRAANAIVD